MLKMCCNYPIDIGPKTMRSTLLWEGFYGRSAAIERRSNEIKSKQSMPHRIARRRRISLGTTLRGRPFPPESAFVKRKGPGTIGYLLESMA